MNVLEIISPFGNNDKFTYLYYNAMEQVSTITNKFSPKKTSGVILEHTTSYFDSPGSYLATIIFLEKLIGQTRGIYYSLDGILTFEHV